MPTSCPQSGRIHGHPCFGGDRHRHGRIHLAVAPRCNIQCRYCSRRHDCANESRPGVASRVLSPQEALTHLRNVMADPRLGPTISVVGIAGPGDPLANAATFVTLRLLQAEFPQLRPCLSTNGLLLPQAVDELYALGLRTLTVTVNALDPQVGARIYARVDDDGRTRSGADGAALLIGRQLNGIARAARLGMAVKVNSVLIPGVNDAEIPRIAARVAKLDAFIMNVMPLIPQADFATLTTPDRPQLEALRTACERFIGQMRHCQQCRADAVGLLGDDHTIQGESPCRSATNP
jgi:nitrogen fixation protein NifB